MIIRKKHLNVLVVLFFLVIIVVVFQQIYTSMAEQGIASGSPYDNAAAYPKIITILLGVMIAIQTIIPFIRPQTKGELDEEVVQLGQIKKPVFLLVIFAIYLGLLGVLGYHLTTAPMLFAIMVLSGMKPSILTAGTAIFIAFVHALAFEVLLKVVLPGGIFNLNIPW